MHGRFDPDLTGEQFAHPEAIATLRRHRETGLTPGNRVLYLQGIPVAARINGQLRTLADLNDDDKRRYDQLLTR